MKLLAPEAGESSSQKMGRSLLGATMIGAGLSHLTFARRAFRAQVPNFLPELLPVTVDQVVVWSGVVEITLGAALLLLPRQRKALGWILGGFYLAVLPGNVAQWQHHRNAFGLDTDAKRFARLFAQPVPMLWALWSTGAIAFRKHQSANQ